MRYFLTLLLLIIVEKTTLPPHLMYFGTDYYFSTSSGNDGNPGTQGQPFQTLAKLQSMVNAASPGDRFHLKSGEVFTGSLIINRSGVNGSPIVIDTYGGSVKAQITSLANLTSWTNTGGNIWRSTYSISGRVNTVLIDNHMRDRGRFPNLNAGNGGFLTYEHHQGFTNITDDNYPGSIPNWVGAEISIRTVRWMLNTYPITGQASASFTYAGSAGEMQLEPLDYFGYFIQNDIRTLDQQNEWFYGAGALNIYSTVNPATLGVKVATVDTLVRVQGSYLTFQNIDFQGANKCLFYSLQGNDVETLACNFNASGGTGVKMDQTTNLKIWNTTVSATNYRGIDCTPNCTNASLYYTFVDSSSMWKTLAGNGNLANIGVFIQGNGAVFAYGGVNHSAYNGLNFTGDFDTIKYNYATNYNLYFDDGAGIYTSGEGQGRAILYNTVTDGPGNTEGSGAPPDGVAANGIGLDDASEFVDIGWNTVARNSREGLGLHNTRYVQVHDNTFYDNGQRAIYWEHDILQPDKPVYGINIKRNILVSLSTRGSESNLSIDYYNILMGGATRNGFADFLNFGQSDSNSFRKPTYVNNNDDFIRAYYRYLPPGSTCVGCGTDDSNYNYRIKYTANLEAWQRISGQDLHSTASTFRIPYTVASTGAELYSNSTFTSNINDARNAHTNYETLSYVQNGIVGGSLKATYTGSSRKDQLSALFYAVNPATLYAGHIYRAKMQMQAAADNVPFKLITYSDGGGGGTGGQLDTIQSFKSTRYTKNVEQLIYAEKTLTVTYLTLATDSSALCPWFVVDNVSLQEVTGVQFAAPGTYSQLITNPSATPLPVTTDGSWMDIDDNALPKTFTIPAWGSKVMFKNPNVFTFKGKVRPVVSS